MNLSEIREATILVVDDEQANLDLLQDCLLADGFSRVTCLRESVQLMDHYESLRPDLILLDLHMPWPDGFEILRLLGERIPSEEYLPILVLTADVTETTKQRALSGGARDFLTKPLNLTEVTLRISNLLQTRFLHQQQRQARRAAEEASRRALILADASQVLASSFDYHTTLSVLCRATVPGLADAAVADVLNEDGKIERVGAAHVEQRLEESLRADAVLDPVDLSADDPIHLALTQGRTTLEPDGAESGGDGVASGSSVRDRLNAHSLMVVPISATGRIHGALVLAQSTSKRSFAPEDLTLANELARRAALTIENARLYSQALEATKARDELLAVVAHDLRNPLSTVTMGTTMIREEAVSPSQKQHAELVARAAERMNRLIEDLLDSSRVERGALHVDPRPKAAGAVVKEAAAMLGPLAASKQVELGTRIDENLPLVHMDSARILQVLSNLVGNALKFTPAGGRVEIACSREGDEVLFAVADSGAGIPRDQIPHIFGRFWQASDRDTRGIGLGLSIVRGIVQTHGGRIWVESEPGRGSTFFFTLQTAEAGEAKAPTSEPRAETRASPAAGLEAVAEIRT